MNHHPKNFFERRSPGSSSLHFSNTLRSRFRPVVSPCGSYLAYIFQLQDQYKLIVRSIENNSYSIILEKNLSKLSQKIDLKKHENDAPINKVEEFLERHSIKGSFKMNNGAKEIPKPRDETTTNNKHDFQLSWELNNNYSSRCYKISVLDKVFNTIHVFSVANNEFQLSINGDTRKDFRMIKTEWIGDPHGKNGCNFLVIFYEFDLVCKILKIDDSPARFVYEFPKPQSSEILRRSTTSGNNGPGIISIGSSDSGVKYIRHFTILRRQYDVEELVPMGKFRLPRSPAFISWSMTGKWLCVVDEMISLYNIFGIGKIPSSNIGHPILQCEVKMVNTLLTWGVMSLSVLGQKNVDNNHKVLETIIELILLGDLEENVRIYTTNLGISELMILKHRNTVLLEDASRELVIWEQDITGSMEKITVGESYIMPQNSKERGMEIIQQENKIKFQGIMKLKNQEFAISYVDYLTKLQNLVATKAKSISRAAFIWNINNTNYPLLSVVYASSDIRQLNWHPTIPGLLLIITDETLILWNSHWSRPLVIKPISSTIPLSVNFNHKNHDTDEGFFGKILEAQWMNAVPSLRIMCRGIKEFVIIEVHLSQKLWEPFKEFTAAVLNDCGTIMSSDPENLEEENVWLPQEEEEDFDDSSSQLLIDDDTNAVKIINDVQQGEWATAIKTNNEEDTFRFKRRKGGQS
ncbi:hypothetical protein DASC09_049810 [Saccharomycopsis crataegensis]|uniref:Transcription factor IIIC 90kDa subunit N-terminal domain-containing protein n=1 Tax=Saccharomycopsis crataegensis TaxID=43959 RepID=A0AAV5QT04_9ASCO|nr:hypothetical protein DASC09_049810 [Saccharomycopsis crataegensis]